MELLMDHGGCPWGRKTKVLPDLGQEVKTWERNLFIAEDGTLGMQNL